MALFKKAMAHHKLAGKAIKSLDRSTAMKHVGHMLNALKATSGDDAMGAEDAPMQAMASGVMPPNLGAQNTNAPQTPVNPLRARLMNLKPKSPTMM